MSDPSISISSLPLSPASPSTAAPAVANRPRAARTALILEGRVVPTLLRLAAPNVLNVLALAGMITFDGLFLGRLGADALAGELAHGRKFPIAGRPTLADFLLHRLFIIYLPIVKFNPLSHTIVTAILAGRLSTGTILVFVR
jgi:hypothetical protein